MTLSILELDNVILIIESFILHAYQEKVFNHSLWHRYYIFLSVKSWEGHDNVIMTEVYVNVFSREINHDNQHVRNVLVMKAHSEI